MLFSSGSLALNKSSLKTGILNLGKDLLLAQFDCKTDMDEFEVGDQMAGQVRPKALNDRHPETIRTLDDGGLLLLSINKF